MDTGKYGLSYALSLDEHTRLSVKMYIDNIHARSKYGFIDGISKITFGKLFNHLLNEAPKIEFYMAEYTQDEIRSRAYGAYIRNKLKNFVKRPTEIATSI